MKFEKTLKFLCYNKIFFNFKKYIIKKTIIKKNEILNILNTKIK